ncbi:VWA domain-containing protein [Exilibacterium tricleocarpae]|uniref:VWA domain-containing protein n=1 Tax=Exilibacterium tricleocarpae TaxID=2591008 RepID=A0A545U586_9GAMM|nr:vWA domain-containing protein [Exilibacterium tricleocarpae]TQV84635.1 VWA domain-containing protein [Exilibacterium tricleocarpae]
MARKRGFSTFSLSFLDIMSCGFGAVALIFLIIKHETDNQVKETNFELQAEVNLLQEEVNDGEEHLVRLRNTLSALDQQLVDAQGLARRINEDIEATRKRIEDLSDSDADQEIRDLQEKLRSLDEERQRIEDENEERRNDVRRILGQGDRQYLTGLKLGGSHVLILLDSSASMLDNSLVNVIRRRNMSDSVKRASKKWQRSLATVEWLVAKLPQGVNYQIYTFNTEVKPALKNSLAQWQNLGDADKLDESIANLRQVIPAGGTNLERAFRAVQGLDPMPDNVFLITDGLPTQGAKPAKRNTVSGTERLRLFDQAVKILPRSIPVNVILAPMEGDPLAAAKFWRLAQISRGSFLSPSEDWP